MISSTTPGLYIQPQPLFDQIKILKRSLEILQDQRQKMDDILSFEAKQNQSRVEIATRLFLAKKLIISGCLKQAQYQINVVRNMAKTDLQDSSATFKLCTKLLHRIRQISKANLLENTESV